MTVPSSFYSESNFAKNKKRKEETVSIVGTGITSIMTALRLSDLGYPLIVYSKGPDPRLDHDAEQYGATGNGRSARFVTGLEGKPHLFEGSIVPDQLNELFSHFSDGGWLTKPISEYPKNDQAWLTMRHEAATSPGHIANLYDTYYTIFGRESILDWIELQELKPALFAGTDTTGHKDGVLVLCSSDRLLEITVQQYKKYNFLKRILTKHEVTELAPVYEDACNEGHIAGGLIVDGFAFNIHNFIDNCLNYLEQKNVQFVWNEEILRVELNSNKRVIGLETKNIGLVTSKHYSLNPGAYGNTLLDNTPAQNKIAGVAGRWLIIPRPEGFTIPTKILTDSRLGPSIGDNNLTPFTSNGKEMVAVSGGSVFVGSDHYSMPSPDICRMIDTENERILQLYLVSHYNRFKDNDDIKAWTNTCLRSFTYNDQPVHEAIETEQGGVLTITAGTNTGTTALAPYLAKWTAKALTSKEK